MTRWWMGAALVCSLGCSEKTAGPSAPSAAAGSQAADTGPLAGLDKTAARCKADGVSVAAFQTCTAWRQFAGRQRRDIGRYNPRVPSTVAPFMARIEAAVARLADGDPYVQAAARGVLELGLNAAQGQPTPETTAWVGTLANRLTDAKAEAERIDLLRILGNHAAAEQQAALVSLGQTDPKPAVRAAAWSALGRCTTRGCTPDADEIKAAWAKETTPHVRGALAALGAWLSLPEVTGWCAPLMDDAEAGPGCRTAMKRQRNADAFKLLAERARRMVAKAPAGAEGDRAVAEAVADLLPVADLPEVGGAAYEIYDAFMRQPRHGLSVAMVGGQLLVLKDKARAADIAVAAYERVSKAAEGDDPKAHSLAESRLRKVIMRLGAGPRIGLVDTDAHGGAKTGGPPGHEGHGH